MSKLPRNHKSFKHKAMPEGNPSGRSHTGFMTVKGQTGLQNETKMRDARQDLKKKQNLWHHASAKKNELHQPCAIRTISITPTYGWNFRDNQKKHTSDFPKGGPEPPQPLLEAPGATVCLRIDCEPHDGAHGTHLFTSRLGLWCHIAWDEKHDGAKKTQSGHERNMFFSTRNPTFLHPLPHILPWKNKQIVPTSKAVAQSLQSSEFLTALKVNVDGIPSDIYKTKTFVVIKVPDHASHLHPIHHLHTSFQQAHIPGSQKFKSLKWLEYTLRHHAASKNAKLCKSLQNQTPTPANHKVPLPKQKQRCAWHSLSQVRVCPPVPAAIRPRFHPTCGVAVGQATSTDHPRCREISATHPSPQTWT